MIQKNTVLIGASDNPERYSYKAIIALNIHKHPIYPIGIRKGDIDGIEIITSKPQVKDVDTVTIYLNENNQKSYYDYVIGLKPKRVIFNPGAENPEFINLLAQNNIEAIEACTLVMLSLGNY